MKFQLSHRILLLGSAVAMYLFAGCVTREDIRQIQTDIHSIEERMDERLGLVKAETENVQINQADLSTEIRELNSNISALNAELTESRENMKRLAVRLDDMESSLTARMDSQIELLSGSKYVGKPLPSTVYSLADADFSRGRYTQAIDGYKKYIDMFPHGERVPEARIKIADAHFEKKDYDEALNAYEKVIKDSSDDVMVPEAMFRKGKVYEIKGNTAEAKEIYRSIVTKFPHKKEAELAKERFLSIQTSEPQ